MVFLHEVVPGAADRSYGLQVARLAGLPPAVVDRAQDDPAPSSSAPTASARSAPSSTTCRSSPRAGPRRARRRSATRCARRSTGIDPDEMTPREALEALYRLKRAAKEVGS